MTWRDTLKKHRIYLLAFLLVEATHGFLGSPRGAEGPKGSELQPVARESAARERTEGASSTEPKRLPLRQVERKARTEKAVGSARSLASSALAPASVPRRVIPKDGVAPEIAALAESFGNSPAEIFRFVHDEIDFDPKWGAEKSPLGTLQERQGTSWDQAWLLQQLLTAAGVDARLEWGEVEIPAAMLQNVTGVEDPWRAGDLMTTAGTPIVLLVEGNRVVTARMSHVWVKAYLDFIPNRGATPGPGDTWIRMDPSLKRFAIAGDLRLDEAVPYDLGEYLQSGTELSPRQLYEAALQDYVTANHPEVSSLEELKRTKSVLQEAFPFVPGTLRGKVLSVAGESVEMPESFAQRLKLEVREVGGPVLVTYETPWPAVYGERLELAWPGATASDQATLDLYGGVFTAPPFEVDLKPSIRAEGVEVAVGSAIGSAEDVVVQATWTTPQGLETVAQWEMFAGEPGVLSLDFGRTSQETVDRYTQELSAATDPAEQEVLRLALAGALYQRSLSGDLVHLAGLRWQRVLDLGRAVLAVQRGAVSTSGDGTPLTFSRGPVALDLGSMPLGLFPASGPAVPTVSTLELLGSQGSFLEGEALGQVLAGDHVTGVTFLTRAVREGQTLTRVDATNVDAALEAAVLSAEAEANVRTAVGQGRIAWISESQLETEGFQATGYVLEDPDTGAGGYFVTFERRITPLDGAVQFLSPADLEVVTAPTDVVATIDAPGVESWTLSTRPVGGSASRVLAAGSGPVENRLLGSLDPTLLLNGMHDLVLTGTDAAGRTVTGRITVAVEGRMKIGNFTLSYVDLEIPLSGLDLEIVRTYDSRDKERRDFGVGWTLETRQGSYVNNRTPGEGWQLLGGLLPCDSVFETRSHLTTIRLSDQEVYRFAFDVTRGAPTLGGCFAEASFQFLDGPQVGATLEILGSAQVFFANGSDQVVDPSTQEPYVPRQVRLRTRDGRVFDLDLTTGVTRLEERNGNELHITPGGIEHSSGTAVAFERDDAGRITRLTDPRGLSFEYHYDERGDLVRVVDPGDGSSDYTYDNHLLVDLVDPSGVRAIRNDYDEQGRLVRRTDALGNTIEIEHDLAARLEVETDRLGETSIFGYDERGNVVLEINPEGHRTTRLYDARDLLLSETDPLGRTTTYEYDANDDLRKITDPLGNVTEYTYDSRGEILTTKDPKGGISTNVYDAQGNLIEARDALGQTTTFGYNSRGEETSVTDALGYVTLTELDDRGNQIRKVSPLGDETLWTYDSNGKRLTETRSRTLADGSTESLLTRFTYDNLERLVSTTWPDGSTTGSTFDAVGRVTGQTDSLGRSTTFTYDALGRLLTTTHPDGTTESQTYDAEGRVLVRTDRGGRTTSYEYDKAGRQLRQTFADGAIVRHTYDAAGQITGTTNPRGHTTTFEYDAGGRRSRQIDALGQVTHWTYDANGNQVTVTDPRGHTVTRTYDALNRSLSTTFPDGTAESVTYDALGRRATVTDPNGTTYQFEYDAADRLLQVVDPLSQTTTFTYDEVGNLRGQTDAGGRTTTFEYDARGRRVRHLFPDGSIESRAYNSDGTVASHTDRSGSTRTFEYDDAGRLVRQVDPDGTTVTFTWTPTGQPQTVVDSRGTTSFVYDARDRLLAKVDPNGYRLDYGYDPAGNLTTQTATVGTQVFTTTTTYDALNRASTLVDSLGQTTYFTHDPSGNLVQIAAPNGIVTEQTFDARDRLTDLLSLNASGDPLLGASYTLDPSGRRLRVDEQDGTARQYTYDALDRLTSERVLSPSEVVVHQDDFTYDPVGNRLERTTAGGTVASTYDSRDRLLTTGGSSFTWDSVGRLTERTDSGTTFAWDFDQRLRSARQADGSGVDVTYDPQGHRVATTVLTPGQSPATVEYLVDTRGSLSHVVAEIVGGQVQTFYTRAGNRLLSLRRPAEGTERYFLYDGTGSVRALTDGTAQVTDRYAYTAFGELLEHVGSDEQPYRFAGEPFDEEAGAYFLRARWMDPTQGRFLSADPLSGSLERPLTLHKYLYAVDNPVNESDPTGLFPLSIFIHFFARVNFVIGFDGAGNPTRGANPVFYHVVEQRHHGVAVNGGFIHNNKKVAKRHLKEAKEFHKRFRSGRIIVMGYSRGGNTASKYIGLLAKNNIPVYGLVTFDPHNFANPIQLPAAVKVGLNFYQQNPLYKRFSADALANPFKGSEVVGTGVKNYDYTGDKTVTHYTIINRAYQDHAAEIDAVFR